MNKSATKNILVVLGILTVCFGAYYLFVATDSAAVLSSSRDGSDFQAMQNRTQVFIERRQILNNIDFDFSLFTSSSFQNLEDFTGPVQDRPFGRSNPFDEPESAEFESSVTATESDELE